MDLQLKQKSFIFIVMTFVMISCKTKERVVTQMSEDNIIITLEKGVCFGECPIYELSIYESGLAQINGKSNMDKLGIYTKQLSKSENKALLKAFEGANFLALDTFYASQIPDLPLVTMGYKIDDTLVTISGKESRPPSIRSLQFMLEKIVDSDGWVAIKPLSKEEAMAMEPPKETIIYNEIIIKPKTGKLPSFLNEMADTGLNLVTRVSSEMNLWLVSFNTSKVDPEEMLKMIELDDRILSAEFNKLVETRDGATKMEDR